MNQKHTAYIFPHQSFHAELYPSVKEVHIFKHSWMAKKNYKKGNKRKNFKRDLVDIIKINHSLPMEEFTVTKTRYDFQAWSASEQTYTVSQTTKRVIPSIVKQLIEHSLFGYIK